MWDHDLVGANDLIGMATFPLPTMTSLVHQPGQPKVDLAPQILMRPQHDAAGSRKDLTGGRGTVEGHFAFTLVERAAVDPHEERHKAETVSSKWYVSSEW